MAFKDLLNQRLIVITYHLSSEELIDARRNRDWEYYDMLEEIEKLQHQIEEFSIYEDILSDITDDSYYDIVKEMHNLRFR